MKRAVVTGRTILVIVSLAACLPSGCVQKTPKGQVVAVVNGTEVTTQDLRAEQRALGSSGVDAQALTQRVVNRVLLAQAAHTENLDHDPGLPADLLRLRQDYLAQALIRADIKPPPAPTASEVQAFIQAHPMVFGQRARLVIDEMRYQAVDGLNGLQGTSTLNEMQTRLKALNTPVQRATITVDTATLTPELARTLVDAPVGQPVTLRGHDFTIAAVVQQRTPVVLSAEQTQALGRQLLTRVRTEQVLAAKIRSLRTRAKIAYQPGYAPPTNTPPAAVPVANPGGGTH